MTAPHPAPLRATIVASSIDPGLLSIRGTEGTAIGFKLALEAHGFRAGQAVMVVSEEEWIERDQAARQLERTAILAQLRASLAEEDAVAANEGASPAARDGARRAAAALAVTIGSIERGGSEQRVRTTRQFEDVHSMLVTVASRCGLALSFEELRGEAIDKLGQRCVEAIEALTQPPRVLAKTLPNVPYPVFDPSTPVTRVPEPWVLQLLRKWAARPFEPMCNVPSCALMPGHPPPWHIAADGRRVATPIGTTLAIAAKLGVVVADHERNLDDGTKCGDVLLRCVEAIDQLIADRADAKAQVEVEVLERECIAGERDLQDEDLAVVREERDDLLLQRSDAMAALARVLGLRWIPDEVTPWYEQVAAAVTKLDGQCRAAEFHVAAVHAELDRQGAPRSWGITALFEEAPPDPEPPHHRLQVLMKRWREATTLDYQALRQHIRVLADERDRWRERYERAARRRDLWKQLAYHRRLDARAARGALVATLHLPIESTWAEIIAALAKYV